MDAFETLTKRQLAVYEFIRDKIRTRGYGPTVREIGTHFDIASPNGVVCHLKALEKKGMITRDPGMSRAIELAIEPCHRGLPLAGRIAAGVLHEAIEQDEWINFGEMFDPKRKNLFVLEVNGDSMIDEHIEDGDYVVVHGRETANNGEMVIALVDGTSATVKRFYREPGGWIRLQPANDDVTPIRAHEDDILVQGVVVGVIRKY